VCGNAAKWVVPTRVWSGQLRLQAAEHGTVWSDFWFVLSGTNFLYYAAPQVCWHDEV